MSAPIVYVDHSDVHPGRLDEVKAAADALVQFVQAQEPQLVSYGFYLSHDSRRMSVVAVHPDSASMQRHLEIGDSAFREFKDLITLRSIEVYGQPDDGVVDRLRAKARMLGADDHDVVIHELQAGFGL